MWWQSYSPTTYIFHISSVSINWYGLILVTAMIVAAYFARKKLAQDKIISYRQFEDLFFYAVVFGLLGARIGHVLFEIDHYIAYPQEIVQIWRGGISLYGSLVGGSLAVWWWCKKYKIKFLHISDRILPFFALAQSIGRWGNYFNQELFGHPTDAWWGIYIAPANRPLIFYNQNTFQPAFFYESLLDLSLFILLFWLSKKNLKNGQITYVYIMGYSLIRFVMEFVRIDNTAMIASLRIPQLLSIILFLVAVYLLFFRTFKTLPNSQK